jgi:uncharacterized protein
MTTPVLPAAFVDGRTDLALELPDALVAAALPWCAYYGDVCALRLLLARGAALHALGADLGLNAAAFHGHWQLTKFLLEQGAPVNFHNAETDETPLHSALVSPERLRHDLVVQLLLAAGADVHARTRPGAETGAFMRDARCRGETALHRAAAFGSVATTDQLLAAGADVTAKDANGDTPLSWASWHGRPAEILRRLCHGGFRIHPEYRPLRENLAGKP